MWHTDTTLLVGSDLPKDTFSFHGILAKGHMSGSKGGTVHSGKPTARTLLGCLSQYTLGLQVVQ